MDDLVYNSVLIGGVVVFIVEQGKGTGAHSVHVAVGCAHAHNPEVLAAVEKVKQCFNKLLITNYVPLKACQCS